LNRVRQAELTGDVCCEDRRSQPMLANAAVDRGLGRERQDAQKLNKSGWFHTLKGGEKPSLLALRREIEVP